jgi:hypothetical protein
VAHGSHETGNLGTGNQLGRWTFAAHLPELLPRLNLGSWRAMLSTQNDPGVKLNEKRLVPLLDSGSAVRRRA